MKKSQLKQILKEVIKEAISEKEIEDHVNKNARDWERIFIGYYINNKDPRYSMDYLSDEIDIDDLIEFATEQTEESDDVIEAFEKLKKEYK